MKEGYVAPRAGAWIEILLWNLLEIGKLVAPRAGAWIEIFLFLLELSVYESRTPCGCVD